MDLLFPGGAGPSLFWDADQHSSNVRVPATPEALEDKLRAVWDGRIEFLILEEGDVFVQAAGQGNGPYELDYQPPGGATMLRATGAGVDGVTMCTVFRKVLAGDASWHVGIGWEPFPL